MQAGFALPPWLRSEHRIPIDSGVQDLEWSGNGTRLLVHQRDSLCSSWRTSDFTLAYTAGWKADFSPDGQWFVCEHGIHDAETGRRVLYPIDGDEFFWSPDSRILTTGGYFQEVEEIIAGHEDTRRPCKGKEINRVLAWSPDSRKLACASGPALQVIDVTTGEMDFENSTDEVLTAAWSPDSRYLACAWRYKRLQIIDTASGSVVAIFRGARYEHFASLAWSPDSRFVAIEMDTSKTALCSIESGQVVAEFSYRKPRFLRDGRRFLGLAGAFIGICDAPTGQLQAKVGSSDDYVLTHDESLLVNVHPNWADALENTDRSIVVTVWRAADWNAVAEWPIPTALPPVADLAFHPSLPLLAVSLEDDLVRIWEFDNDALMRAPSITPVTVETVMAELQRATTRQVEALIASYRPPAAAEAPRNFDVFLCHNSEDKAEVREIAARLRAHDIQPWLDECEIRPGSDWQSALEEAIERISAAAILVGPSGFGPWQNRELKAFLNEFVRRKCPVIPVILAGCKEAPKLPLFLQELSWVDFRKPVPDPLDQLIWGITGRAPGS